MKLRHLRHYYAIAAISLATVASSHAAIIFSDDFSYGDNAFTTTGGWTSWSSPDGGTNAGENFFWGQDITLEYNHTVALNAGDTITMNATINRWSDGSSGVNGYAYTMEILLWDGADAGTITSAAGGVQQGLSANLDEVSYTVLPADAGKQVIFRQGNTGSGTGLGGGWGETSSVTYEIIPEPSSTALLGLGGLALVLRRRK